MIRKAAVSGSFYSNNRSKLIKEVEEYLSTSVKSIDGDIKAIISPHAGYIYSGRIAGEAYKEIVGEQYDYVVVFAPCHRGRFQGASIFRGEAYETPIGLIKLDINTIDELINSSNLINFYPEAHKEEHSLEVQLPFLQLSIKNFTLIPVLLGSFNQEELKEIATIFKNFFQNKRVLFVASTDLSHFYQQQKAKELDNAAIDDISTLNYNKFYNDIISGKTEACGAGAVFIILYLANLNNWNSCKVMKYADSSDSSGDKSSVVGYLSAVIYQKDISDLNLSEKETLHNIAMESIKAAIYNKTFDLKYNRTNLLKEIKGAFVTIKKKGELRGCIGYIQGLKPLDITVKEMALAAAFEDPRFMPVTKDELPQIEIEISVLSPLKKIEDINQIIPGKHGILIKKGYRSGLLLPQVATEYNWDRVTFLSQTCIKAGLSPKSWEERNTEIYIFTAQIF